MLGYIELAASAVVYAIGIVAQSVAARRVERRHRIDPGILARLVTDWVYVLGFAAQVTGFVLAFLARATLPLYLVQAGASTAVGLAAVFGAIAFGWRVQRAEIAVLLVMAAGLLLLAGAAEPSVAHDMPPATGFILLGVLALAALLAVPASRARGPVPLGVLAGLAFAVVAIAGRPLASGSLAALPLEPLAWLMVLAAVLGQTMLAAALQRGTTTATAASMDATSVVIASIVGLAVLGDQVAAGRAWWVVGGLVLVVGGVLAMVKFSAPIPVAATEPVAVTNAEQPA